MSVCGQTEEESGAEEMGAPGRDAHEQKAASKLVRVLTVLAYLLSVSLAAILLSVYYVCVWKSPDLPPANASLEASARRADAADAGFDAYPLALLDAGGSNTTVSENVTEILANITEGFPAAGDGGAQPELDAPGEPAAAAAPAPGDQDHGGAVT